MTVDRIAAYAVRYPEPNNNGKVRSLTLVRVETSDGVVGWGEAITGAQETSLATAFMIERRLSPIVLGRDPRDVRGAWTAMRDATYWDGNGGIVTFGISAIDMALWDVAGRLEGKPVYELLGGARTSRFPACASTILDMGDPERVAREFRGFRDAGYRFVKGGWGHDLSIAFGRDEARDLSIGRTIRDAVGAEMQVILDVVALAGWDAEHAIRMCRGLDDEIGLYWLEDPLPEQDLDGYRQLRAAVDTRICTGEKGWHTAHYRGLIDSGAVDVIDGRPGQGRGGHRHVDGDRHGRSGRVVVECPLMEQRSQHGCVAAPRHRDHQHPGHGAQADPFADAGRAGDEAHPPVGRLGLRSYRPGTGRRGGGIGGPSLSVHRGRPGSLARRQAPSDGQHLVHQRISVIERRAGIDEAGPDGEAAIHTGARGDRPPTCHDAGEQSLVERVDGGLLGQPRWPIPEAADGQLRLDEQLEVGFRAGTIRHATSTVEVACDARPHARGPDLAQDGPDRDTPGRRREVDTQVRCAETQLIEGGAQIDRS